MQVIPVIDLLDGRVVHAQRGARKGYLPLRSPLCAGGQLSEVLSGLLSLHPFDTLYIADLNAIQGTGDNLHLLTWLRDRYAHLHRWIDAGFTNPADAVAFRERQLGTPVIGTETLPDLQLLRDRQVAQVSVLSLDYDEHGLRGPQSILDHVALWPKVIAMTLSRIGADEGPDFPLLNQLRDAYPHTHLYAAGGVRNSADLRLLEDLGVQGALTATALHLQRLSSVELSAGR